MNFAFFFIKRIEDCDNSVLTAFEQRGFCTVRAAVAYARHRFIMSNRRFDFCTITWSKNGKLHSHTVNFTKEA